MKVRNEVLRIIFPMGTWGGGDYRDRSSEDVIHIQVSKVLRVYDAVPAAYRLIPGVAHFQD